MQPIIDRIMTINEEESRLAKALNNYNVNTIRVILSSYGGSVHAGLALMGAIEMSTVPVEVVALGACMSMGLPILCSAHTRTAHRYTTFMYHEVSSVNIGKLTEQIIDVSETQRLQKMIDDHLLEKTSLTEEKLEEIKDLRHDWYFSAEEALEIGLIDNIIDQPMLKVVQEEIDESI